LAAGNRVTLRDWFELSLKEGLTQFRQQLFAADIDAASVAAAAAVAAPVINTSSPLDALLAEAIAEAEAADNTSTAAATRATGSTAASSSSTSSCSDDYAYEDYEESDYVRSTSGRKLLATPAPTAANGPTASARQASSISTTHSTSSSGNNAASRSLQPQVLQLLRSYSPSSPAAAAAESGWQRVLHAQRLRWSGSLYDELRPDSMWLPSMMYSSTVYDKVGGSSCLCCCDVTCVAVTSQCARLGVQHLLTDYVKQTENTAVLKVGPLVLGKLVRLNPVSPLLKAAYLIAWRYCFLPEISEGAAMALLLHTWPCQHNIRSGAHTCPHAAGLQHCAYAACYLQLCNPTC
jgi:hypothetical protein